MAFETSTSRTNNVTESASSRYTQGGTTDRYQSRVGWWERRIFTKSDNDLTVVILANENKRPDLVAYRKYRRVDLDWLVLQYNNIVDVETEFLAGMELRLPTERRVYLDFLTRPTGGNKIT